MTQTAAFEDIVAGISFDESECCDGYQIKNRKTGGVKKNIDCTDPAILHAVRSCCGHIDALCRRCYNTSMSDTVNPATGNPYVCRYCWNERHDPKYVQINFIK